MNRGNWNRRYRMFGSTNGTLLTDDLKQWLIEHKETLTLGLSYDGLPSTPKNNRGDDSIDIDFFISTWPNQPIQMTINADSVSQMAEGVTFLLEKGAKVHPNVAFEETEWPNEKISEYSRQLNVLIEYYANHPCMPPIIQFQHNLKEYVDNIGKNNTQTQICGAGDGFNLFDVDGRSYPYHILSPLVLDGDKLQVIKDGLVANTEDFSDPECSTCPYSNSCPTCIACNYLYRGQLQKRDKTHCKIMKAEVKAYLKKEVMRLTAKKNLTPQDATEIDNIVKLIDYQRNHQ